MGCQASNQEGIDPYFDLIMDKDLAKNQWPQKITHYKQTGKKLSLMAKNMSPQLFNEYKDKKTQLAGWTIARAINTGTLYPQSFVGCHAGDLESYTLFNKLFDPVIQGYHVGYKVDGSMKHVSDLDPNKVTTQISQEAKKMIVSTRIRVARNLSKFPLNPGGTKESRQNLAQLMKKVFDGIQGDLKGQFYLHTQMTQEQKQKLIDDHFLFRGKDKMQAASGYHQYWPHGRGIFHNYSKQFLLWINQGDHLRIISMENGSDIKGVFTRLVKGIKTIQEGVKKVTNQTDVFAKDDIRGHITCCPSNLGTGMRSSVHMLLPKLIEKIGFEKIDQIARGLNCQARGSSGQHSKVIDRIDISNWRRLGFSQSSLVEDLIRCVNKFAEMESQA